MAIMVRKENNPPTPDIALQADWKALHCPLCSHGKVELFHDDTARQYLRCYHCELVFVPERFWLSLEEEKATYDLHENDVNDPGYQQFLTRLSGPLLERLAGPQQGLDFGCGPGPALSMLLEANGHRVKLYDPMYHNDPSALAISYDFICATEVIEHLHYPAATWSTLFSLLKPEGWLGIMTKLVRNKSAFAQWHYIRDLTHVCFYSKATFTYLAQLFNAELYYAATDVILLKKIQ